MHALASGVLTTWRRNTAYAARLVGDLSDEQFMAQPAPGRVMNHGAWILSHLNVYAPVCTAMLRRRAFVDPIDHPHGQKSRVSMDPGSYEPRQKLIALYRELHDETEGAFVACDEAVFALPNPLERRRDVYPTLGEQLVTFMVKHESAHLGQLSAWRRALGMPSVPM